MKDYEWIKSRSADRQAQREAKAAADLRFFKKMMCVILAVLIAMMLISWRLNTWREGQIDQAMQDCIDSGREVGKVLGARGWVCMPKARP